MHEEASLLLLAYVPVADAEVWLTKDVRSDVLAVVFEELADPAQTSTIVPLWGV